MIFLVAWVLVGSSVFLSAFYYLIYDENRDMMYENYSMPDELPSVAILVPAYNEELVVSESLQNLLSIDYPRLDIVFIDDCSEDSTLERAKSFDGERLEVISLDENRGKSGALNKGLEFVEADYTAVQDADSVIHGDVLSKAVAGITSEDDLGAVIARIRPLNEDTFFRRLQMIEYMATNFHRKLMSTVDVLDITPGAFSLYRTDDLKDLNGFDVGNLTEDQDMAWRIRKKGGSIKMVYGAVSNTELPASFSDLKGQRVRWARGFINNMFKHSEMMFRSKYGWFSRFHVPASFFIALVSVAGIGLIGYGLFQSLYNFLVTVSAVGLSFSVPEIDVARSLLLFQWKVYTPLFLGFFVTGTLLRSAYKESDRSVDHPLGLAFYFFAFFFMKSYFWSNAIFKELTNSSRIWT